MNRIAVTLLAATCVGCVSTNAALMDASVKLPPICPEGVALFSTTDKVGKDYKEIAILNSTGDANMTSEADMYKSQQKKAASIGANGIILNNINEPKPGTKVIAAIVGVGVERKGSSLAIYIPEDTARVRSVCAGK
jgi:hypothetical protein